MKDNQNNIPPSEGFMNIIEQAILRAHGIAADAIKAPSTPAEALDTLERLTREEVKRSPLLLPRKSVRFMDSDGNELFKLE